MAPITCATCGCLNFSSDTECDKCRAARAPAAAVTAPHPFLTHPRATGRNVRPAAAAPPRQQQWQWAVRRRQRQRPDENGSATPTATGAGGGGGGAPVRINPPGWSVLRGPTSDNRTTTATMTSSAAEATTASIGNKRPRAEKNRKKEVIDLISSDEEDEDEDLRAAVQESIEVRQEEAAKAAGLAGENGRQENGGGDRQEIATRSRGEEEDVENTAADGHTEEERIPEPFVARCFDNIAFDIRDFPTEAQMAELARQAKQETVPIAASVQQSETSLEAAPRYSGPFNSDATNAPIASSDATRARNPVIPAPTQSEPAQPVLTAVTDSSNSLATAIVQPGSETVVANSTQSTVSHPPIPSSSLSNQSHGSTVDSASAVDASVTDTEPTSMSQPIVLDDSEEEEEVGEEFDRGDFDGRALFQSRRFDSVVFNHVDFASLHDGLNVARRSGAFIATAAPNGDTQDLTSTDTRSSTQLDPVATAEIAENQGPVIDVGSDQGSANVISSEANPSTDADINKELTAHDEQTHELPVQESAVPSMTSTPTTHFLEPRRKNGERAYVSTKPPDEVVIKRESSPASTTIPVSVRIIKPALGHCSVDFLRFMRECVEDDSDEDDEELVRAKLLDVVDLTSLTDESDDDDDDDDDEVLEVSADEVAKMRLLAAAPTASITSIPPVSGESAANPAAVGMNLTMSSIPVVKRKRAPRPKELCILCEEKAWIKALVHCPECKKYYHKRCAREYGDESVCWNCDLDGMIDDSGLTEDHKEEIVGMFSAFRSPSDSETGEDDADEKEDADGYFEEKAAPPSMTDAPQHLPVLGSKTTKSMRRWKEFLEVATSKVDRSFEEVTNRIARELEDEEQRTAYSKGFASKESVEAAMAEVVDHYASLQEKEERLRATIPATGDAPTQPSVGAAPPTERPAAPAEAQSGNFAG